MYKNRFRSRHNPIDWPVLLKELREAGMTNESLGEITGKATDTIRKMVAENIITPPDWDGAFALIDLYVMLKSENNKIVFPTIRR